MEPNHETVGKMKLEFLSRSKFGVNEPSLRKSGGIAADEHLLRSEVQTVETHLDEGLDNSVQKLETRQLAGRQGMSQDGLSSSDREGVPRRLSSDIAPLFELIEGSSNDYRCKLCKQRLGKRNATRFRQHSLRDCRKIDTPEKQTLARNSKSKTIGPLRSRSDIGLALERAKNSQSDDLSVSQGQKDTGTVSGGKRGRRKRSQNSRSSGIYKRSKPNAKEYSEPQPPECNPEFVRKIRMAAIELAVTAALPFSVLDKHCGQISPVTRFVTELHPELGSRFLPSSSLLSGALLDAFYANTHASVKVSVTNALRGGYATLIFDGWEDVNSAPVVNVLLKTEPAVHIGNRVFFLKTVYTGSKKTGAAEYVKILEDLMQEYGGMSKICAITSDNTSSCLNARKELTDKYSGIVGVNDQGHVADLLIEDIGKIAWVKDILTKVSYIPMELHNRRKLKERFKSLMAAFNKEVKESEDLKDVLSYSAVQRGVDRVDELGGNRDPAHLFDGIGE